MTLTRGLSLFSAVAFLGYGIVCVSSTSMVGDFRRFGLENLRILTGVLEIVGGAGLLVGIKWLPAQAMAAGGLSLLMLIAFCIRVHMRDRFIEALPSFLLAALNGYILFKSLHI